METKAKKNGWFLPCNDKEVKKDLQKKYGWFSNILYMVLLMIISGYFFVHTVLRISTQGLHFYSILKIIILVVLFLFGLFSLKGIHMEFTKFKNAEFYVKTCKITNFRGETSGKQTYWYVTVEYGEHEVEYHCKNNPWLSDQQIAAKKEITLATFDDVTKKDGISMVYILDKAYTNYRVQ